MGENDKQIVNFDRICRLCLHEKRTLTEIFESTADNNNLSIDQKIMTCATIDLCKGDGLPSRICTKCLSSVNAAFDFRVQCENADRTLHDFLNKETNAQKEKEEAYSTNEEDKEENEEGEDEEEAYNEDENKVEKTLEPNVILTNKNNELVPRNTILGENTENVYYIFKNNDDHDYQKEEEEEEEEYEDREPLDPYLTANIVYYGDENDPGGENEYCLQLRENYQHEKYYKVLIDHEAEYLRNDKKSFESPNNGEINKSPCPFCHKMLTRVDEHIRLLHRNKIYVCTKYNCGAQFSTLKNLQSHQLNCFDLEKAYKCPYCNKEFHRKSNYKAHVKRHEDKKEFQCQLCDKAFVDSTGLRRHFLKHHEPDQKVYVSTCCGKRFRSKEGMKKHVHKRICGMNVEVLHVIDSTNDDAMEDEIRE